MIRRIILVILLGSISRSIPARAQPGDGETAARLRDASAALVGGDYDRAAEVAGRIARTPGLDRLDRAEALRIYGLALFFLGKKQTAERALLLYLKLQPDAHLDPAQVPPEALVFFSDVRARHAAVIAASKPKPARKTHWYLNLIPPFGQFQNGHRTKGWLVGTGAVVSLAVNVSTFLVLRSWCDRRTAVCTRENSARTLEKVNVASGVLAIGLFAYGVLDGFHHYRRLGRKERKSWDVVIAPTEGGGQLVVGMRF